MSASNLGSAGANITNKVLRGTPAKPKGPAQPPKLKRGPKGASSTASSTSSSQNSKAASSGSKKKASLATPIPADVIENAPRGLVLSLYKQLLRRSRSFQYTDKGFFARRMHAEFMKRKDVKDNNLYYIRGKWMLENNMGGLL